jgi:hypothetical protein
VIAWKLFVDRAPAPADPAPPPAAVATATVQPTPPPIAPAPDPVPEVARPPPPPPSPPVLKTAQPPPRATPKRTPPKRSIEVSRREVAATPIAAEPVPAAAPVEPKPVAPIAVVPAPVPPPLPAPVVPLIDSIPGDAGYTAIRRVIYVPVTPTYAGELLTSTAALQEAIELGLVGEPVPAGTWRNMPVVAAGTKLEVSATLPAVPATEVYARGYRVDLFPLGGALGIQPLRNNVPLGAQESRLLSGVATGVPPVLSTALDAQPVFQLGIPAAPPTTTPNYSPIVTELDVRLATAIAPATILSDARLFTRATSRSISGYLTDNVASFAITTTVSNKQIQFVDGEL